MTANLPVNETAKALAIAEAQAAGIKEGEALLFDIGTKGYSANDGDHAALDFNANYKRAHQTILDETKTADEAADAHIATIAAEQRADLVEKIQDWRVNLSGEFQKFTADGKPIMAELSLRENAYKQLAQITKAPAWNVNAGLTKFHGKERRIRARKLPTASKPEVFAVTGGPGDGRAYAPFDSDRLVDAIRKIQPDSRVRVEYDQDTTETRVKVYSLAPLDLLEFGSGVGRVHHVVTEWRTGDNGTTALSGQMGIVRAVCRNAGLALIDKARLNMRHSGNYERLAEAVNTLNSNAGEVIESLRKVWQETLVNQYLDAETGNALSPQDAIVRLVAQGMVPLCGLTQEEAEARYIDAWRQEPVYSAGGVIMAIQRAAHAGSEWKTRWYEDDIEDAASNLLYAKVYTLAEPEADAD